MKERKPRTLRWLLFSVVILGCHADLVSAAEKPNIIFIFADDWGYGDLSCHGSSFCETPRIDRMANEGIDFSNFTVNSPVCSPSRVAVMTGQFPARQCIHQHFAGANSNRKRGMPDWLDPQGPSLPRMFKDLDEQKKVYASVIAEGDEGVGRILDLLKELGLDENTLVVFSTDNGPEATRGADQKIHRKGEPGLGGFYSVGESGGLKGRKRSLFAGGIRVPFIVRWPGVVPAGKTDETSVLTAVDLLPTFLEIAGVALPDGYEPDGQSAVSAFKGEGLQRTKPIFWEWRGGISKDYTWPTLGIRHGRWKLLVSNELQKMELYDLENDWAEKKDVSQENVEIVEKLRKQLKAWKRSLPLAPNERCCAQGR